MASRLARHFQIPNITRWIDEDSFVGTIERRHPQLKPKVYACYGWSKGNGFFIYQIVNGHIQKVGSLDRKILKGEEGAV